MTSSTQPRSSDSYIDLEHAVTLHELRELTVFEKEHESPPPERSSSPSLPSTRTIADRQRPSSVPHSVSSNVNRAEELVEHQRPPLPPPSLSISSQNPRNSGPNTAETDKLLVFRDEAANVGKFTPRRRTRGQNQMKQAARQIEKVHPASCDEGAHVRSDTDPEIPNTRIVENVGEEAFNTSEAQNAMTNTTQKCVAQLQAIALQRHQLLRQLSYMHQQEQSIISLLRNTYRLPASSKVHGKQTSGQLDGRHSAIRCQEQSSQTNGSFTASVPVGEAAVTAPRPSKGTERRPVSAPPPPPSTRYPQQDRNGSSFPTRRIPLADKTEASQEAMPSSDHILLTRSLPIQQSLRPAFRASNSAGLGDEADQKNYVSAIPTSRGRRFQVPTHFGFEHDDNDGRGMVAETPTTKKIPSSAATGIPKWKKSNKACPM